MTRAGVRQRCAECCEWGVYRRGLICGHHVFPQGIYWLCRDCLEWMDYLVDRGTTLPQRWRH